MEKVTVNWKGDMAFESKTPSGAHFVMDTYPEEGQVGQGPTPFEAFVTSAAACSAIDVMLVLNKRRQKVDSYRIEVEYERTEPGVYPRPITKMIIKHIVKGENIDEAAVAQAVKLSDEKYCSVVATLRAAPQVESVWSIE